MNAVLQENYHKFVSPEDALRYAYWCEAKKLSPSMMEQAPAKDKERPEWYDRIRYMRPLEIITDGMMIKNSIIRAIDFALSSQYRLAVGITFRRRAYVVNFEGRVVEDSFPGYMKDSELQGLATDIMMKNPSIRDKWYVVYVLKRIVGDTFPEHQTEDWWSTHLDKSARTLRRWRKDDNGIERMYDNWYGMGMSVASNELRRLGMLE